jgi:prophage regulatory protein
MKVIRLPEVKKKTGLGHTSIYEGQKAGTFPKSIELGPKARGWVEEEIDEWIEQRVAQRDGAA